MISIAIKYSKGKIDIELQESEKDCIFNISNDVEGISEDQLSRFFDKFYMVDKARNRGGTGLGLYIVKTLLEKIQGEILEVSLKNNIIKISIRFRVVKF